MKLHEIDFTKSMKLVDNYGEIWLVDDGELIGEEGDYIYSTLTMKEISKLEFEIQSVDTGWNNGEDYGYVILVNDDIGQTHYTSSNLSSCNAFTTHKKAKEVADEQKLYRKIKKFRDENDKQLDWMNKPMIGYCIEKDSLGNRYGINASEFFRGLHTVYFTTEELAKKCLDEIVIPFIKNKN